MGVFAISEIQRAAGCGAYENKLTRQLRPKVT